MTSCKLFSTSASPPSAKHISELAEAGYVAQRRAVRDTGSGVWLRLTETGRSAYRGHVAALRQIVGDAHADDRRE